MSHLSDTSADCFGEGRTPLAHAPSGWSAPRSPEAHGRLGFTWCYLCQSVSDTYLALGFREKKTVSIRLTLGNDYVVQCCWIHRDTHPEPPRGATRHPSAAAGENP